MYLPDYSVLDGVCLRYFLLMMEVFDKLIVAQMCRKAQVSLTYVPCVPEQCVNDQPDAQFL